ncbi:MAG: hypothetical protein U1E31_02840 [Rickettsiales bacterium]
MFSFLKKAIKNTSNIIGTNLSKVLPAISINSNIKHKAQDNLSDLTNASYKSQNQLLNTTQENDDIFHLISNTLATEIITKEIYPEATEVTYLDSNKKKEINNILKKINFLHGKHTKNTTWDNFTKAEYNTLKELYNSETYKLLYNLIIEYKKLKNIKDKVAKIREIEKIIEHSNMFQDSEENDNNFNLGSKTKINLPKYKYNQQELELELELNKVPEFIFNNNGHEITFDSIDDLNKESNEDNFIDNLKRLLDFDLFNNYKILGSAQDLERELNIKNLTNIKCLVLQNEITNKYELFFPGTEDTKDKIKDVKLYCSKFNIGIGYNNIKELDSMLANIIKALNLKESDQITVAGHSLGGYFAESAKAILVNKNFTSVDLYAFDSPGVKYSLKNYFGQKVFNEIENKIKLNNKTGSFSKHFISQQKNFINTDTGGDHIDCEKLAFISHEEPENYLETRFNFIKEAFKYHSINTLLKADIVEIKDEILQSELDEFCILDESDKDEILQSELDEFIPLKYEDNYIE